MALIAMYWFLVPCQQSTNVGIGFKTTTNSIKVYILVLSGCLMKLLLLLLLLIRFWMNSYSRMECRLMARCLEGILTHTHTTHILLFRIRYSNNLAALSHYVKYHRLLFLLKSPVMFVCCIMIRCASSSFTILKLNRLELDTMKLFSQSVSIAWS